MTGLLTFDEEQLTYLYGYQPHNFPWCLFHRIQLPGLSPKSLDHKNSGLQNAQSLPVICLGLPVALVLISIQELPIVQGPHGGLGLHGIQVLHVGPHRDLHLENLLMDARGQGTFPDQYVDLDLHNASFLVEGNIIDPDLDPAVVISSVLPLLPEPLSFPIRLSFLDSFCQTLSYSNVGSCGLADSFHLVSTDSSTTCSSTRVRSNEQLGMFFFCSRL